MKFVKQSFMGIELDVLVGHLEHDLLFIATQAVQATGLTQGKRTVQRYKDAMAARGQAIQVRDLKVADRATLPAALLVPRWADSWLFTETAVYEALLKSKAPQSEPFRKWVTEEVLPSIRKTGKYNAEDSQNPIALAIMDELKSLRGEIVSLRQELQAKTFSLEAPVAVEVSPYEGQRVARQ